MYDTWMSLPPSVEDDISLNEFTLEQNYPNHSIQAQKSVGSLQ
jgi:hypothetical protein